MVNTFPYWIEDTGTSYNIWTKVSIPANSHIELYITKDDEHQPNGEEVFEFFDDFDDGTWEDKWEKRQNPNELIITEENSKLHIKSTSNSHYATLTSKHNFNDLSNFVVICKIRYNGNYRFDIPDWNDSSYRITFGTNKGYNFIYGNSTYNTLEPYNSNAVRKHVVIGKNWDDSSRNYDVILLDEHDNIIKKYTNLTPYPDGTNTVRNICFADGYSDKTVDFYVDYIFVHKYSDKEPTVNIEQIGNNTWKVTIINPNDYDLTDFQVKILGDNIVSSKSDGLLVTDLNLYSYWIDSNLNIWIPVDLEPNETKTIYLTPDNTKIPNTYFMKEYYKTALDPSKWNVNCDFIVNMDGTIIKSGNITTNYTVDNKIVDVIFENVDFDSTKNTPLIKIGNDILVKYNAGKLDFYLDYSTSPDTITTSYTCDGLLGWKYVRDVTVNNPNSTELTDFQVKIELDDSFDFSKCQPNGEDIRVVYSGQKLSYWIEEWDTTNKRAIIWTKVPKIPVNSSVTLQLYYGNSGASSKENGNDVFEFFDDFDGTTLDINKWELDSGFTYTMSNSEITIDMCKGASANIGFDISGGYVVQSKSKVLETHTGYSCVFGSPMSSRYTASSNKNSDATILYMGCSDTNNICTWIGDGSTSSYNIADGTDTGADMILNQYSVYEIAVNDGIIVFKKDDIIYKTYSVTSWSKQLTYVRIGYFNNYSTESSMSKTVYDYIFVRKYADNEPTCNIGIEQTLSSTTIHTLSLDFSNGITIYLDNNKVYEDTSKTYTGLDTISIGDENNGNVGIKYYEVRVKDKVPNYTVTPLEKNI